MSRWSLSSWVSSGHAGRATSAGTPTISIGRPRIRAIDSTRWRSVSVRSSPQL
jgi:hypothetical protein